MVKKICYWLVTALLFVICYFISMHFSYYFLDEVIILYTTQLSTSVVSIILMGLRYIVAMFFFFTLRGIYHSIKYRKAEAEDMNKVGDIDKISQTLNAFLLIFYLLLLSLSLFFISYYGITEINIIPFNMIREYMYIELHFNLIIYILFFTPMGILIRKISTKLHLSVIASVAIFISIEIAKYFFLIRNFEIDRIILYMTGFVIGILIEEISRRRKRIKLENIVGRNTFYFLVGSLLFLTLSGFIASNVSLDGSDRFVISIIEAGQGVYFDINADTGYILGFSVMENEEVAQLDNYEFRQFIQQVAREYFGEDSDIYQEFIIFLDSIYW